MFRNGGKLVLLFATLLFTITAVAQDRDTKQTEKRAQELFEKGQYSEAKKLYSNLVSLYPKEPNYNFKYGACILYTSPDKTKALKYLDYAVSRPDVEPLGFYYAAQGYHYNYRFEKAINYYEQFSDKGSNRTVEDLNTSRKIQMCQNGQQLFQNVTQPIVKNVKSISSSDFYLSYKFENAPYKFLKTLNSILTDEDEDREYKGIMYKHNDRDTVWYASYGEDGGSGLDIYFARVNENGELKDQTKLPRSINTPYDEEFPFFNYSTNTLYFASKGHTSMGGYDIFRSEYDPATNSWSDPENMDYAINTPDDDFLYAVSPDEKEAIFTSSRNNDFGKVNVYTIDPVKRPLQQVIISGKFESEKYDLANITVQRMPSEEEVGTYKSDLKEGSYVFQLKGGEKYRFLVKPDNSDVTHAGMVEVPELTELRPLKQEMKIVDEDGSDRLIIKNLFDEKATEEDEELIANFLSNSASLSPTKVSKNINKTNDEIIAEVEEGANKLEKRKNKFADLRDKAYQLASDKLDEAKQLKNEGELSGDKKEQYEQLIFEANTSTALAQQLERERIKTEKDEERYRNTSTQLKDFKSNNNREEIIKNYEELNSQKLIPKKEPLGVAKRNFRDQSERNETNARELRNRYADLQAAEKETQKNIDFYEGQAERARKKRDREQYELQAQNAKAELEDVRSELERVEPKLKKETTQANQSQKHLAYMDEVSENLKDVEVHDIPDQQKRDLEKRTDEESIALLETKEAVEIKDVELEDDSLQLAQQSPGETEQTQETEEPAESESVEQTEQDEVQESAQQEETQDSAGSKSEQTKPKNQVPENYEPYFAEKEEQAASIPQKDKSLLAKAQVQEDKLKTIENEIDELENQENLSGDQERKLSRLKSERAEVNNQLKQTKEEFDQNRKTLQDYLPDNDMMEYTSVQDLEDKYFFDYGSVSDSTVTGKLRDLNDVNERYVQDVVNYKKEIEQSMSEVDEGSAEYQKLQNELEALEKTEKIKKEFSDYNEELLATASEFESEQPSGDEGEQIAQTDPIEQQTSQSEPEEQEETPVTEEQPEEATAQEQTPDSEEFEELEEETAVAAEEAEDQPADEETLAQETEPAETEEQAQTNEAVEDPAEEETLAEETQPEKTEEQAQVEESGDYGNYTEEELRNENFTLGESKYRKQYSDEINNIEYDSQLERAQKVKSINEEWLADIEKEIAVIQYNIDQSGSDETREALNGKLEELQSQKRSKERQIDLNDRVIAQLDDSEGGGEIADAESPETDTQEEQTDVETESQPETEEAPIQEEQQSEPQEQPEEDLASEETSFDDEDEPMQTVVSTNYSQGGSSSGEKDRSDFEIQKNAAVDKALTNEVNKFEREYKQAEVRYDSLLSARDSLSDAARDAKRRERKEIEETRENVQQQINDYSDVIERKKNKLDQSKKAKKLAMKYPESDLMSETYQDSAQALDREAQLLEQEANDLRDQAGNAKRKDRDQLIRQAEVLDVRADDKKEEAQKMRDMADGVKPLEEKVLTLSSPMSKKLVVDMSSSEKVLTENEQQEIQQSEPYQNYQQAKEDYDTKIQEATVIYEKAQQKQSEAEQKAKRANELEAQNGDEQEIEQLRDQSEDLMRESEELFVEGRQKEGEAYYDLNMARKELNEIEDERMRENTLAYVGQNFKTLGTQAEETDEPQSEPSEEQEQQIAQAEETELPETVEDTPQETATESQPDRVELSGSASGLTQFPRNLNGSLFSSEVDGSAYSENNPIPINAEMPQGIAYRVQIGAFRNPIPQNTFAGIQPIMGETAGNGITRYFAGLFSDYNSADEAKDVIRSFGYSDAFVVAYNSGDRISVTQARNAEGTDQVAQQETTQPAQITEEARAAQQRNLAKEVILPVSPIDFAIEENPSNIEIASVENRGELFFTIQIGVFRDNVEPRDNFNFNPLNRDNIGNGTVRYSTGIYADLENAVEAKNQVRQTIPDAFVTAYYQGERITIKRALELGSDREETTTEETPQETTNDQNQTEEQPTTVTEAPDGIEEGQFTVQVGPYVGQVPIEQAREILNMTSRGINIEKNGNETRYQIGKFDSEAEAENLARELSEKGMKQPNVVKFVGSE
ncbi:SPOR domain-containing protein [Salibacter halophilus]|uniref:SPOR domain-containing protein n=1 Tax=Salibacter halophilus TaxID=1803916 RepID=A0A6N6MB38_9FLAO|nr:SPOR domain-containing protein [Salibacter halophilus]KAB1064446.1 hypothetical protein F3059_07040 [Salibacter halophilus]